MKTKNQLLKFAGLFAVAAALQAPVVHAQETADQDTSAGRLDEIVVTAQKRSENLQSVPIAVTALTAERLQDSNVTGVQDLSTLTPSTEVSVALGVVRPFVRGVGNNSGGAGVEAAVATYVDGVYINTPFASAFAFNDIARLEVLKGPQGTLFGRNATGGVINIVTLDPGNELSGRVEATYGNYAAWGVNGTIRGPLGNHVGGVLSVQYNRQGEGYGANELSGADINYTDFDLGARGKLVFDFDRTTIQIAGEYYNFDAPLYNWRPSISYPALPTSPISNSAWDANSNVTTMSRGDGQGVSARIEHEFNTFTLLSISAYRETGYSYRFDPDMSPAPQVQVETTLLEDTFTQEFQLQSNEGSFIDWTLGAFYYEYDGAMAPNNSQVNVVPPPGPPAFLFNNKQTFTTVESTALFGQATIPLFSDRTRLTAGLRYTSEDRTLNGSQVTDPPGPAIISTTFPTVSISDSRLTWRLSLDHQITEDMLVYASYNRGFRSGGFVPQFPTDPAFEPELVDAYEIGFKSELFNNRLRFNLSGYFNDYQDRQFSVPKTPNITIINAGRSETLGVEAEIEAVVSEDLTIYSGLGWMNSEITSFPVPTNPLILNCSVPNPPTYLPAQCDLSGNTSPQSPEFTFNVGANWSRTLPIGRIFANVNVAYNSGFYWEPDNLAEQEEFYLVGGQLGWTDPNQRFSIRLWGKNLTDEAVAAQSGATQFGVLGVYQPPRTYGVTLGVAF